MALKSRICEILGIEYPILLAGMGGASVPALAAAVSNAGGLGVLGAAACSPDQLRNWIRQTREMTDKPFGVDSLLPASVRRGSAPQSGGAPDNPMALLGEYQQFTRDFMEREHLPKWMRQWPCARQVRRKWARAGRSCSRGNFSRRRWKW